MPALRFRQLRFTVGVAAVIAAGACGRDAPAVARDSATAPSKVAASASAAAASGYSWNRAAGPVLLLEAGETGEEAIVLVPDEADSVTALAMASQPDSPVVLFGRGGARMTAQFGRRPEAGEAGCRTWPLHDIHPDGPNSGWSVGFVSKEVSALALDSIEVLPSRDSMALAAEASRLASAVTALTSPSFDGLRFSAHDVRRFEASPGVQALVAHLIRRVNQEANPQEEQTLIIAERDSGVTSGPYQLVYADRAHGLEEQVVTPEVIAGVLIAGRATLLVARDQESGVAYALIERTAARQWRVRWMSAPVRCS